MTNNSQGKAMEDLTKFKNKIFIYGILIMLIAEVISLPIHGFDWKFSVGLLLGTAIAIANFNIMTLTSAMILEGKHKALASMSYLIRLLLYGGVFYVSIKLSVPAGIGSICGIMTLKVAIFIIHAVIPHFKKDEIVTRDLKKVKKQTLINYPQWIGYGGGKRILTFKRFVEYKR